MLDFVKIRLRRHSALMLTMVVLCMITACTSEDQNPTGPGSVSGDVFCMIQSPPTGGQYQATGPAPLWVVFSSEPPQNSSDLADTLIWDYGVGVVDTVLQDSQGRFPATRNIYFEEGSYDVRLTALKDGRQGSHFIPDLVTVTTTVERPAINLEIIEEPITRDTGEAYRYYVTPIIENLLSGGEDDRFYFVYRFDVNALDFQGISASSTDIYECEIGFSSDEQHYWTGGVPELCEFSYGGQLIYPPGEGEGPIEIASVSCDVGVSYFEQAFTSPRHYTRLDTFGNRQEHPWDCEGPVITYIYESENRNVSYLGDFWWIRTSFNELDGVVLKINGSVSKTR